MPRRVEVSRTTGRTRKDGRRELRIPIVEERAVVGKRIVEDSAVRIHKSAREREQILKIPVESERVQVKRVEVGRAVDAPQAARREGETIIIPVMEQVPVVRLQWVIKEEIHITRATQREERQQRIRLRSEEVSTTRSTPGRQQKEDSHGTYSDRPVRRDRPGKRRL